MKKTLGLLALSLFSTLSFADVIDDGIEAAKDSMPTVVRVSFFEKKPLGKEELVGICSGTMISNDIVVTAAHCVDNSLITRVSLIGDNTGKGDKASGGILVKKGFKSSSHDIVNQMYKKGMNIYRSPEFQRMSAAEKESIMQDVIVSGILMRGLDIGFLQLDKPQVFKKGSASTLGCRQSLAVGNEVTIAGYGRKAGEKVGVDYNPNSVLNSGTNIVVANQTQNLTYKIEKKASKQLANSGDSGGPMFKKDDLSVVYGVTSAGVPDENDRSLQVDYANLSSDYAKKVYQDILADKSVPASLLAILNNCK